jgi:hypothetical protein
MINLTLIKDFLGKNQPKKEGQTIVILLQLNKLFQERIKLKIKKTFLRLLKKAQF